MNSKGDPKKDKDDLLRLARELDGVIEDNHLGVFDKVCAETVSRVRNELIRLAALAEPQGDGCRWTEDEYEGGAWDTDCGQRFCIEDGTPEQNDMKFCCYCGHKILPPLPKE